MQLIISGRGVVLNKAKVGKHSEYYYPYHNAESTA